MPEGDDYDWAERTRDSRLDALSITLVAPIRPDPIAILRPDKELGGLTIEQILDRSLGIDDYGWRTMVIAVDELDDWTVIVEPNGYLTSFPRTLEALSDGGRAGNVFWNVNAGISAGPWTDTSSDSSIRCSTTLRVPFRRNATCPSATRATRERPRWRCWSASPARASIQPGCSNGRARPTWSRSVIGVSSTRAASA